MLPQHSQVHMLAYAFGVWVMPVHVALHLHALLCINETGACHDAAYSPKHALL